MATAPEQMATADGQVVCAVGQGTWYLGDDPGTREEEIAALRAGIEAGLNLIDTAEMYGGGRSEDLVGAAIAPVREQVYLVDKVLPSNASRSGTIAACERSLRALGTDWIDLYLLHWPGPYPEAETVAAFEELIERGLIRSWGVSNFDPGDLAVLPAGPLVNQVLYNPSRRGVEVDLLPAHRAAGITTMAYSPIEQGRLLDDPTLAGVARRHGVSVAQVLIAWAVREGGVIAIPKASTVAHVRENAAALELRLDADDLAAIDAAFPAPDGPVPLEIL
ncbi:aldo/keto reductase [Ruania zhangjianzhongii]|uniref:aldo/keto reductase n=1 Tax=Ruania zhangjianzhongii TaxID=2603206 RepID=UPI001F1CE8E0|nr:aldo/keto reductase [Ruania zhangjianzhongii]